MNGECVVLPVLIDGSCGSSGIGEVVLFSSLPFNLLVSARSLLDDVAIVTATACGSET